MSCRGTGTARGLPTPPRAVRAPPDPRSPHPRPSPLDARRGLAPGAAVQPLAVEAVSELLPPVLPLGLRHGCPTLPPSRAAGPGLAAPRSTTGSGVPRVGAAAVFRPLRTTAPSMPRGGVTWLCREPAYGGREGSCRPLSPRPQPWRPGLPRPWSPSRCRCTAMRASRTSSGARRARTRWCPSVRARKGAKPQQPGVGPALRGASGRRGRGDWGWGWAGLVSVCVCLSVPRRLPLHPGRADLRPHQLQEGQHAPLAADDAGAGRGPGLHRGGPAGGHGGHGPQGQELSAGSGTAGGRALPAGVRRLRCVGAGIRDAARHVALRCG